MKEESTEFGGGEDLEGRPRPELLRSLATPPIDPAEACARDLVAMVAHDLRAPLHAIVTAAQAARMRSNDAATQDALWRVLRASDRMARMIGQLVEQARVAHGLALAPAAADLELIVERVFEEIDAPPWRLRLDVSGDARGTWDADWLTRLASNLIANAVEHGAPDAPVSVRIDGREALEVVLRVHHQGAPISDERCARLFEPFAMIEEPGGRRRGIGLGLYVAREIARAHGGAVSCDCTGTQGTTFVVRLPRHALVARGHVAPPRPERA